MKEIPFGKKYEIRTSIGAYENDKWFYYLSKFVSKKSAKSKKAEAKAAANTPTHLATAGSHALAPEATSGSSTPVPSASRDAIQNNLMAQAYNDLAPDEELNCIAITQYCFKCGRITVPPPIALAMAGLGEHGKENHKIFEKLVKQRKIKEYMKGGYKDSAFADVEFNINDLEVINAQRVAPYKVFNESLSAFKTH